MTGTKTVTLTEFLLERIAEDEEAARGSQGGGWTTGGQRMVSQPEESSGWGPIAPGWVLVEPRHIFAECDAKRRIVEWLRYLDSDVEVCIQELASVYADHPDYRAEWSVG